MHRLKALCTNKGFLCVVCGLFVSPLHLINWQKLGLAWNGFSDDALEFVKIIVEREEGRTSLDNGPSGGFFADS